MRFIIIKELEFELWTGWLQERAERKIPTHSSRLGTAARKAAQAQAHLESVGFNEQVNVQNRPITNHGVGIKLQGLGRPALSLAQARAARSTTRPTT